MKSVVSDLASQVPMYWPSRMMVTSSLMRRISSILWEIYTMDTPLPRSSFTMVNSASTSRAVREEVGSSRMSTLQSADTALAISTSCIWDTLRLPSLALGLKSRWTSSSTLAASSYIFSWSMVTTGPNRLTG